jgi:phosphatidylglycerol:prolipoprotein diacylglycerol transferase
VWPFHVRLGPFDVGPAEILFIVGVAASALVARRRMEPLGITAGKLLDLALAGLIGGAVGARLFSAVPAWIRGEAATGSGLYGGLLLGGLAVALAARAMKLPVVGVLDAGASAAPLGFSIGKIGCFLAGCCFGAPWPGGVTFAAGSLAARTHPGPVHPTQLYEAAFGLALFAATTWIWRRSRRPGTTLLAFALLYSAWRFAIEFLRDDPGRRSFGLPVTDSQAFALVVMALAGFAGIALLRSRVPPPNNRMGPAGLP